MIFWLYYFEKYFKINYIIKFKKLCLGDIVLFLFKKTIHFELGKTGFEIIYFLKNYKKLNPHFKINKIIL